MAIKTTGNSDRSYKQGVLFGNTGHVRVTVSPGKVTLDYVKSRPSTPVANNHFITAQ